MLPTILLPAPVKGTGVELPEAEEPLALETTVKDAAEHDVVGADVRVTNWLVEEVVGHDAQTMVDPVADAAALHRYGWKAVGMDVSFEILARDNSSRAYRTTQWQRKGTSYVQV